MEPTLHVVQSAQTDASIVWQYGETEARGSALVI